MVMQPKQTSEALVAETVNRATAIWRLAYRRQLQCTHIFIYTSNTAALQSHVRVT